FSSRTLRGQTDRRRRPEAQKTEQGLHICAFGVKRNPRKGIFTMKHLRKFTRFLSPQLFMAGGAVKVETSGDEILEEVFAVLNEYRLRKMKSETIFVETAVPLSAEMKQDIKRALLVPSSTPLIE